MTCWSRDEQLLQLLLCLTQVLSQWCEMPRLVAPWGLQPNTVVGCGPGVSHRWRSGCSPAFLWSRVPREKQQRVGCAPPPPWVDWGLEFWRSPPIVCACPSHAGRDGAPCFSTGPSGVQWLLRVLRAVVVVSCSRRGQLRRGERFHGRFWTVSKRSKPEVFSDGLPDSQGKKLFEAFSVLLLVYLLCLNESVWDSRRQCSQVSDSCVCAGST